MYSGSPEARAMLGQRHGNRILLFFFLKSVTPSCNVFSAQQPWGSKQCQHPDIKLSLETPKNRESARAEIKWPVRSSELPEAGVLGRGLLGVLEAPQLTQAAAFQAQEGPQAGAANCVLGLRRSAKPPSLVPSCLAFPRQGWGWRPNALTSKLDSSRPAARLVTTVTSSAKWRSSPCIFNRLTRSCDGSGAAAIYDMSALGSLWPLSN